MFKKSYTCSRNILLSCIYIVLSFKQYMDLSFAAVNAKTRIVDTPPATFTTCNTHDQPKTLSYDLMRLFISYNHISLVGSSFLLLIMWWKVCSAFELSILSHRGEQRAEYINTHFSGIYSIGLHWQIRSTLEVS